LGQVQRGDRVAQATGWQDVAQMSWEALEAHDSGLEVGPQIISVGLGRRVVVAANLGLTSEATEASTRASVGFAGTLDAWQGPGTVIFAGNLFDLTKCADASAGVDAALEAHQVLAGSLERFAQPEDRRLLLIPGATEGPLTKDTAALERLSRAGLETAERIDLRMHSGNGVRVVRVEASVPPVTASDENPPALALPPNSSISVDPEASWQSGINRLSDPGVLSRFLTSRLLYRRFARFAWWLVVPFAVAVALHLAFVSRILYHLFSSHPGPRRAIHHAVSASWGSRLAVAGVISAIELLLLALILGWLARRAWRTLGGGHLGGFFDQLAANARGIPATLGIPGSEAAGPHTLSISEATVNDAGREFARALVAQGYAGLVTGSSLEAELTHLAPGFFACTGTVGEVVEEHAARFGLLPVFLHHEQLAWVELETGAELHARLLLGRTDQPPATFLERVAARSVHQRDPHPVVVAACPQGESWPPAPDLRAVRNRSRRVRRWAGAAIFLAGAIDLLSALTPPVRSHLHVVVQVVPLGASQAAGALVALAGVALLALARGVRRGQRRAWVISSGLVAATLVLHLARGVDVAGSLISVFVLTFLLVNRREFTASTDLPSMRSALKWLAGGVVALVVISTFAVQLTLHLRHDRPYLPLWKVGQAVTGRLVGVQSVKLPERMNEFLSPSLLAIGFAIAVVALLLATRPLVDRRRSTGHATWAAARDIVRRHGDGTLDYFALRSDKRWFFYRDSLVAYAIYGGVCLVSPDPIGPMSEREHVWGAFRRFADSRGWIVALMGAGEQWLPIYRATGMHDIYIGDEAVVDVQTFSLAGGHMKGLRQAYNRIARYGYTASFHDPSRLDRRTAERLTGLMSQGRRGEFERGFSMAIGRIFDPRDQNLLMCVVNAPDGSPAAMCQFVPARGIDGFSLDLMRRDRGDHPNGLLDFALLSTIEHLRSLGYKGLSMNFAALRSVLEGERGDGITQRVERWALKKMSGVLQIETLWHFNAKYEPSWLPRYVVYDTAEHLVAVVLAILRAESLSEVPVIGRVLAASGRRTREKAGNGHVDASGASLLPSAAEREQARDEEKVKV
jgi:lysylphosphatidylglycerol synthetase-like protein (DUF2156 family)